MHCGFAGCCLRGSEYHLLWPIMAEGDGCERRGTDTIRCGPGRY